MGQSVNNAPLSITVRDYEILESSDKIGILLPHSIPVRGQPSVELTERDLIINTQTIRYRFLRLSPALKKKILAIGRIVLIRPHNTWLSIGVAS